VRGFNLQRVCARLSYSTRDSPSCKLSYGIWILISFWCEVRSHYLISHEIQSHLYNVSVYCFTTPLMGRHTYGATPAIVGIMPLYKARMPPSVLYIVIIVSHMPGSFSLDAWLSAANDADWIERRVRTISRGYVKNTDVIPAAPPHTRRRTELRSAPGDVSKNYSS
jgi:hypothetical protein